MDKEIRKIVAELKGNISNKYDLQEMRLFGSTVRGNRSKESLKAAKLLSENGMLTSAMNRIYYSRKISYDFRK